MDISLLFAGLFVSLLVNTIKDHYQLSVANTNWLVIGISIAIGGLFTLLKEKGWWDLALQVYICAGAVYAFVIKNLEKV